MQSRFIASDVENNQVFQGFYRVFPLANLLARPPSTLLLPSARPRYLSSTCKDAGWHNVRPMPTLHLASMSQAARSGLPDDDETAFTYIKVVNSILFPSFLFL